MRILCLISEKIELDELLELFVELQDLSSERRVAKERLLTESNVLGKKKGVAAILYVRRDGFQMLCIPFF